MRFLFLFFLFLSSTANVQSVLKIYLGLLCVSPSNQGKEPMDYSCTMDLLSTPTRFTFSSQYIHIVLLGSCCFQIHAVKPATRSACLPRNGCTTPSVTNYQANTTYNIKDHCQHKKVSSSWQQEV